MAEIAAGFLGPALEVVRWVGAPILRQFSYLCCFSSNITSLKNEAEKLQDTERDLQGKVDAARNDVQVISGEVEAWLRHSKDIKDETDGILNEVPNVEGGCLKLRARFSLSRRAKKTTDRLKELRDLCKFNDNSISLPGPPPAKKAVPSESSYEFKSRKQIEEDIMTTLRGEDVNMIGICGMRGLGKTTMAKRITYRALEDHVFEEVVMAVVSRPIDKLKIQLEIGGSLGLKKLQEESSETRVQKLHARLSGPKRILLVLDDVWEKFRPEDLGIPRGCTILLTSRNRDVLNAMNVQKIFGMEVLSEEDSWLLFKMGAGQCVDDTKLNSIAKEVVSECAGLPIVLITVGAALRGEVDVSIWENALQQLRINCTPDIPEYIAEVYNPIKLSYDALEPKYQDVFLLCCVYPEDVHIPLEQLTYFCMGLRLLEGAIGNVEAARNRIRALSKVLKSRSLLLDSEWGDKYVRMHDVVRDVCIFIAKQEGYIGDNDMTSSLQRYKLHSGFELLQIRNSDEEINFDGITDLYVLSIESCSQLTSLPFTQMLRNLYTLVLNWCPRVDTLSVVGELVNLEILICCGCDAIKELPPEIKGLNRLKVLDLTRCENLQRIGQGIISSLVGLEELKMLESFNKWEAEDREEKENAGLKEVETLSKLRSLEIDIEDLALATENIRLSSKVDRFTIRFLHKSRWFSEFDEYLSNKKMCLNLEGASSLGDWIKVQLLRDTECLLLVGNGANEVGVTNLEKKIRYLELRECESMKNVVTTSMDDGGGATVFPSLDHLILFNLPKLEEICDDRISSNSFQNLKILTLYELPALKQLWKSSQNDLGKDFLPQLEVLEIEDCEKMEAVFLWKGEDGNENNSCHPITIRFPKLKELNLSNLPNLISLCQGIEGIEFPLMRKLYIRECGKMKGMTANGVTNNENNSGGTHHIFCESRVSFGCLKVLNTDRNPFCSHTIHVSIFNGLEELSISTGSRSLFTSSMAGNLVNLKELLIEECDEMVEVIKDDEEKGMSGGRQRPLLLFPKLDSLELRSLPKLVSFCELKCDVEFPSLREVEIYECPNMKNFTLGSLAAPNLESFQTDLKDYLLQPAAKAVPLERSYEFKSRKQIEEDIMSTLRGEDVKMIGICGMGGLGKTTMAKRIWNRVLKEHVFQEVAMAVVSQPIDKLKIQLDIAGPLGLKLEGKSPQANVQKLHERLSRTKRTLVILDDVWETLELEDLGIPHGYKGCTILLTSRSRDVLNAMNVQMIFGMEVLSEEDSWFLFKERVGTCVDDTKLNSIAKEVMNECGRLPIALITVGAALKGKVNVSAWKNALRQLKRHDPDIQDFIKKVYNPLKLSYDALEPKYQDVFLLCCLYPEDAHISLEQLTYFCMGLRLLEGAIGNVEEARNRIRALSKVLKSRSLLLDSEWGDEHVRMHDVVRDVCINIARKNIYISGGDSSLQRYEFDPGYTLVQIRDSTDEEIKFDGIRDLYVLSIERCSQLTSLPFTQRPNNLITLVLDSCEGLETLSVVGELVNLEILICRDCDWIEELPPEIKGLNRLKVLDLTRCRNLQRICRGIISSLVGLEELKMLMSFKKWEEEDREERENVGLKELGQLTKLRCLEIEIEDFALATENIRLSSKVDRFSIRFKCERDMLFSNFDEYLSNKRMCLNWEGASCLGDWIKMQLLRDTECLLLVGNGANEVGVTNLKKIRYLELGECESMTKVVTSSMDERGATVFPSIEHLILFNLPKLEEICDDPISSNSFQNLKILKLNNLPVLKQLWKSSQNDLGKDFLPRLEVLEIWNCEMMEGVFLWKGEDGNENNSCHPITIRFPKLKVLQLYRLPNLISLCQGIEGIEFPLMRNIEIIECGKMKGMVWNEKISGGSSNNTSIHDPQQVSFGCAKELEIDWNPFCSHTIHVFQFNGLEKLTIYKCTCSLSSFTSSMAGNLVNLTELRIEECDEMVEVIKDDEEKGMSGGLLFPKLDMLELRSLPKLVSFCELKCDVEFPSLREVDIRNCPNMKNFTLGSLAAPNLESFVTDLNNYLLQAPFISRKKLSVEWNEKPLNCYQIHGSVFDRLEELRIHGYKGCMSLFSSSITGNLVNLRTLTIRDSDKMVKVIEEKEEEKEKVVSGAQRTTILFPKLRKIELWNLPKLVRFCEWKCDVELPSLRELKLTWCNNMKSFTLGPLNTPKLKSVEINRKLDVGGVKDLNGLVQQRYLSRVGGK